MTDGEKMIWATAYAAYYKELRRAGFQDNDDIACGVAENATDAVLHARTWLNAVVDGYGEDSEVTQMLREMVEVKP